MARAGNGQQWNVAQFGIGFEPPGDFTAIIPAIEYRR